eukprot:6198779-Pleurochrysis_carterae.AAC.1
MRRLECERPCERGRRLSTYRKRIKGHAETERRSECRWPNFAASKGRVRVRMNEFGRGWA